MSLKDFIDKYQTKQQPLMNKPQIYFRAQA